MFYPVPVLNQCLDSVVQSWESAGEALVNACPLYNKQSVKYSLLPLVRQGKDTRDTQLLGLRARIIYL